ncbi:MAG TPA: Lrp/AsnC family transcriptional regulator [Mycobacteriales bacterium]|nr:Lrp/AsnC family transcriptional regulator [Mycobacteriales bacterium]
MMRVEELDRQIVALLVDNARRPFAEIGQRVGLSASAVTRRVDRLEREGVLTGYAAQVGGAAAAWRTEAFVELFCERVTPDGIRAAVEGHPEVVAAYTVTGDADALLHLRAADATHLEQALERIRESRMVQRTRTVVVLTRLFERPPPVL